MWSDLARYAQTRLCTARIALLWMLVTLAVLLGDGGASTVVAALDACVLLLGIAALRLWDDLEDLEFDRIAFPERVLVNTGYRAAFVLLAMLTGALAWLLLANFYSLPRAVAAAAGVLVMALVYRYLPSIDHLRPLRAGLVLLKYPGFVMLLVPEPLAPRALLAAGTLYFLLGLNDALTTPPVIANPGGLEKNNRA